MLETFFCSNESVIKAKYLTYLFGQPCMRYQSIRKFIPYCDLISSGLVAPLSRS